jgi:hypothetical protein
MDEVPVKKFGIYKIYIDKIHTKEQLMFALEDYKRFLWHEIKDVMLSNEKKNTLVLDQYALERIVFNDYISRTVGPMIFTSVNRIKPYAIISQWFTSIGIKHEIVKEKDYVYFKLFF